MEEWGLWKWCCAIDCRVSTMKACVWVHTWHGTDHCPARVTGKSLLWDWPAQGQVWHLINSSNIQALFCLLWMVLPREELKDDNTWKNLPKLHFSLSDSPTDQFMLFIYNNDFRATTASTFEFASLPIQRWGSTLQTLGLNHLGKSIHPQMPPIWGMHGKLLSPTPMHVDFLKDKYRWTFIPHSLLISA